ncbi:hypothetical protein GNP82_08670 [Aliivibrio fischeri]|uniref:hypothetical protein n=1 Tax=Aliivibrio fischeri TaxID=668 RepID=UPI0012D96407|nr:hypothetical protein [Aliivibrio fischeri]MUK37624.1 hypothetical protein [Aliivibrio fischeri]
MRVTNILKFPITFVTAMILTLAFIASIIRHSFWLLALIPIRTYKKYTSTDKKKRFIVVGGLFFLILLYQPYIQLPNASFIGFSNQMEYHLDKLTNPIQSNSGGKYPTSIELISQIPTAPKVNEKKENNSNMYRWWETSQNEVMLRPESENKLHFLKKRNVSVINDTHYVRVYNSKRMNEMFPYEPIPEVTTSFSPLIMSINEGVERGRPPYPKHIVLVLIGYAFFIWIISKITSFIMKRIFQLHKI